MAEAFLAGLLAGYGVAVPVGAIAVLIMGLAAQHGWRVGAAAAMGVATADGIYATGAVLGGTALAGVIQPVTGPLRLVAAVVLIGLAGYTAVVAVRRYRADEPSQPAAPRGPGLSTPGRAYLGVLLLTLLNPATVIYFAALILGRRAGQSLTTAGEVLFVVGSVLASASWQLVIASGGSLTGRLLSGRRGRLVTAGVSSLLIVTIAAGVLFA